MNRPYLWLGIALLVSGVGIGLWQLRKTTTPRMKLAAKSSNFLAREKTLSKEKSEARPKKADEISQRLEEGRVLLRQKGKMRAELIQNPHGTPPSIMQAAEFLGQIEEWEGQFPERKKEFQSYYQECFRDEETMSVTRVQCLKRYVRIAELKENDASRLLSELPSSVQRLYKRAPP